MSEPEALRDWWRRFITEPPPAPDYEAMREAGRRAAEEQERRILDIVFAPAVKEDGTTP